MQLPPVRHRFLAALGVALSAAAPAQDVVTTTVMVPMRDGVRLSTNVTLPAVAGKPLPGPFPVILSRTPYGKGRGVGFARRGYATVNQDVRGRGGSEGTFYIYVNEGADGYDTMAWIRQQPWCNGRIGTYGGSYLAATQHALAALRPPGLKAMFVQVGTANYVRDGAGRGGAFALLHNLVYATSLARTGKEARADRDVARRLDRAYAGLADLLWQSPFPPGRSPLRAAPSYDAWYADWWRHSTYDDYWKQNGYNFEERYEDYPDDVAIYNVGGWYDIFKRGTLRNAQGLAGRKGPTRLLMGPWTHGVGGRRAGSVDYGESARVDVGALARAWFDRFLGGVDNGIDREPRVRYFVMGAEGPTRGSGGRLETGGEWRSAATWPPAGTVPMRLCLHPGGVLGHEPPAEPGADRFTFDPHDPVPTLGGNIDSGSHLVPSGPRRQVIPDGYFAARSKTPLSRRKDVLTFQTPQLAEAIEAIGPMSVTLWVSSSARDTDFTARLIDVYPPSRDHPDGYPVNIEDGILRMRFRDGFERETFMDPDEVYCVEIDLWATANRFAKGHRIRLDISSSNFPMFDVNPNTGEQIGRHRRTVKARNTVYHGPQRPSSLNLSVMPVERR